MSSEKRRLSNDPAVFGEKGHKIIPSRICPKKDLTTREYIPSDSPIYRRCAKRKQRSLSSNNRSRTVHYLNRACHMKIAEEPPSFAKKQKISSGDRSLLHIYKNVHKDRPLVNNTSCFSVYCVLCRASHSMFCYCGAGLSARMKPLNEFVTFVKSPRNPVLNYLDPSDQQCIKTTLEDISCRTAPELLRVLCIFAMISNDAVMKTIGKRIKRNENLDALFKNREDCGLATFRGGQFAGSVSVAELSIFLRTFMNKMRNELCPLLYQWSDSKRSKSRCVLIVRQILTRINICRIAGFGPYKRKKFAEFLILVGIGKIWGNFEQSWIRYLADVWPVPSNSATMLKEIFPSIKAKQRRSGIVALLRCLRHHKHLNFPCVIAQLCFWSEQRNGRINWL